MIFNFDFRPLLGSLMHCSNTLTVCGAVCLDGKNNFPEKCDMKSMFIIFSANQFCNDNRIFKNIFFSFFKNWFLLEMCIGLVYPVAASYPTYWGFSHGRLSSLHSPLTSLLGIALDPATCDTTLSSIGAFLIKKTLRVQPNKIGQRFIFWQFTVLKPSYIVNTNTYTYLAITACR